MNLRHLLYAAIAASALPAIVFAAAPNRPVNKRPIYNGVGQSNNVTLIATVYSDPDGSPHRTSRWQISTSSSFSPLAWDEFTATAKTNITVPEGVLTNCTRYYWHVQYEDNTGAWSPWSTTTFFQTIDLPWIAPEGSTNPMGVARGIFPGRVAWARTSDATLWNGVTTSYWLQSFNNYQPAVDLILSNVLLALTGQATCTGAWDALFRSFNETNGRGLAGYVAGEKIAIKANYVGCHNWEGNPQSLYNYHHDAMTSPQMTLALLRQLVRYAGVPQTAIYLYESQALIGSPIWNYLTNEFPAVHYVDNWGIQGREQAVKDYSAPINLSNGAVTEYPPAQVTDADYLINMPTLKSHEASTGGNNNNDTDTRAEFPSLCAKNHFGSFCGGAGNLHPYQEATNYYATYHCYVDLMEHKHLGGKTMLYVIDGLYGGLGHWDAIPAKWWIPPFNTNWPGSVFASQDHCAIDSVGLDFLAAERVAKADVMRGKLDNHLHEAANITNPPSGTVYDPDGDGPATRSLGVHEHWLDLESKLYSKNIDPRVNGIELVDASVIEPLSCAFVANVTSVGIGSPVIFTATVTSTFSRNVYCRWDFNNDGTTDLEGPYLLEVTNAFPTQMYFSVKLDMSNEVAETASMLRPNYINVVPEPVAAALLLLASCAVRRMTRA